MSGKKKPQVIFGHPKEWADFDRRRPRFAQRLPRLKKTLEAAFAPIKTPRLVDRIVRNLLRTCVEDFFEILLLVGNGYGVGAQKLLRGLYERAVTASTSLSIPGRARDFWTFSRINMHKLIAPLEKAHGRSDLIPPKIRAELAHFHARYKRKLVKTASGKMRIRSTSRWSDDLSFEVMAEQCGSLGRLLPYGWHLPTFQVHASGQNILSRVEQTPRGDVAFIAGPQRKADEQLVWAHLILVSVLEIQLRHFHRFRKMKSAVQQVNHDLQDIWQGHCPDPPASGRPVNRSWRLTRPTLTPRRKCTKVSLGTSSVGDAGNRHFGVPVAFGVEELADARSRDLRIWVRADHDFCQFDTWLLPLGTLRSQINKVFDGRVGPHQRADHTEPLPSLVAFPKLRQSEFFPMDEAQFVFFFKSVVLEHREELEEVLQRAVLVMLSPVVLVGFLAVAAVELHPVEKQALRHVSFLLVRIDHGVQRCLRRHPGSKEQILGYDANRYRQFAAGRVSAPLTETVTIEGEAPDANARLLVRRQGEERFEDRSLVRFERRANLAEDLARDLLPVSDLGRVIQIRVVRQPEVLRFDDSVQDIQGRVVVNPAIRVERSVGPVHLMVTNLRTQQRPREGLLFPKVAFSALKRVQSDTNVDVRTQIAPAGRLRTDVQTGGPLPLDVVIRYTVGAVRPRTGQAPPAANVLSAGRVGVEQLMPPHHHGGSDNTSLCGMSRTAIRHACLVAAPPPPRGFSTPAEAMLAGL